jgi:hypothetical protein
VHGSSCCSSSSSSARSRLAVSVGSIAGQQRQQHCRQRIGLRHLSGGRVLPAAGHRLMLWALLLRLLLLQQLRLRWLGTYSSSMTMSCSRSPL